MKGKEKRSKIFKKFATNLKECLDYHGLWAVTKLESEYKRVALQLMMVKVSLRFI